MDYDTDKVDEIGLCLTMFPEAEGPRAWRGTPGKH